MAFRIRFSDEILGYLSEIGQYIVADSPQNAEEVTQAILDTIDSLKELPSRFQRVGTSQRSGLPVHMATTHSFNIYYRIEAAAEAVVILLIQRGTRRAPRRFK